jgi:hypothetical protein
MPHINLQIPEDLLAEATRLARARGMRRTAYVREAIARLNERTRRELVAEQLQISSKLCRAESEQVCREMEAADASLGEP